MPIIDVGKIPAGLLHDEWETQVIRFHGFEGLPAERNVPAESPTFICFGHEGAYGSILVVYQHQTMEWSAYTFRTYLILIQA